MQCCLLLFSFASSHGSPELFLLLPSFSRLWSYRHLGQLSILLFMATFSFNCQGVVIYRDLFLKMS